MLASKDTLEEAAELLDGFGRPGEAYCTGRRVDNIKRCLLRVVNFLEVAKRKLPHKAKDRKRIKA